MPRTVVNFRRAGLLLIGLVCVLAGLGLVNMLVRPGVIGQLSTLQLWMIAGLLVWPWLTYVLLRVDDSVRKRAAAQAVKAQHVNAQPVKA